MNVNVKRTLCMCAAALLVSAAGAGAVSAAEPAVQVPAAQNQQSTTLGYAQIDQLVRNNNPQVRNNALTRRNMEKNGNDQLKEGREQLQKAIDSMQQLVSGAGDAVKWAEKNMGAAMAGGNAAAIEQAKSFYLLALGNQTSLTMTVQNLEAQLDQMKVSKDQRTLVNLQLDQVDDQMVSAAQSLFGVCKQLENSLEQMNASRPLLETSLRIAQVQVCQGTGTQLAVTEAQISLTEFDQNLTALKNQLQSVKYQLNNLLGRAYDTPFTLGELPQPDLAYFTGQTLAERTKAALANSYSIRYKLEELSQIDNDEEYKSVERTKQMKRNEISMEQASVQASMAAQDANVRAAQNADQLQRQKVQLAQTKYTQAQMQ